ncbi:MAG TPA: S9 family peptidase [Candidatus Baltobacteraceae bacterium]|nr:S9 family peptidase [Candidatus Baltobacteraceae bacterium]
MKLVRTLILIAAFAVTALPAHAAQRPVSAEDLYKLVFVGNPQISPDGTRVVFEARRMNGPKDRYETDLYLVRTDGRGLTRITHSGHDSGPAWSPDSRTIAFTRGPQKKGEQSQIYTYTPATGTLKQLTHVKDGASSPVYSHGGKRIAFTVVTHVAPHAAYADFKAAGFKPRKEQRRSDIRIIRHLFFETNGAGYTYEDFPHIWVMNADGSGARAITSGTRFGEGNPAWSPDDKTIAFNSLRYFPVSGGPSDVYTIASTGGAMHKLPSSDPANYLLGYDRAGHVWYFSAGVADPAQFAALMRTAPGGARQIVAKNATQFGDSVLADMGEPGGLCGPQFAPGDAFALMNIEQPGYSALVRLNPQTGMVTKLTTHGEAAECTMDAHGRYAAYTLSDFTHPREVYVLDLATGKSKRVTGLNDAYLAGVQLSQPREFTVNDDAGFPVQAWFMPAVGPKAHGKRPTILDIHGGPQTQFGQTFFHEFQYLAGQGYNVVFSDPRGSTGHGYAFEAALNAHWGEAMFDDVQRVMDRAARFPGVDANRLGVSGGSYGGYATLWVISHTGRYKAAIAERAVSNLSTEQLDADFAGANGFGAYDTKYGFGPFWDPKSLNYAESPLTFVENVHTPLLILHSDEDTRTPIGQTIQEFTALKILGRTVEYVDVPGENHDLSRTGAPLHRVERLHILNDWLGKYLSP